MLHNLRRLCSYGLSCVLLVSCLFLTPTKAAVDYPDDGVGFWKMMSGWVGVRAIKAFLDIPEADATEQDWQDAYEKYVQDFKTNVGTVSVVNGGIRFYLSTYEWENSNVDVTSNVSEHPFGAVFIKKAGTGMYLSTVRPLLYGKYAPFDGQYSYGYSMLLSDNVKFKDDVNVGELKSIAKGAIMAGYYGAVTPIDTSKLCSFVGSAWVDLYPYNSALADYYENVDFSSDIRLGSLSNSWAYVGDNGIVTVDNSQLFNETTNNFYNPATNENVPVTDWSYDYSDRSYGITLDDGRIGKIVYGDDSATVNLQDSNGNTITYNYYYTSPDGSGGGSGGEEDGEGNWFTDLLKKLGELLGGVLGGLLEIVGNALLTILDSLITLVSSSVERLSNLVNLFGSFGEALSVLWSWLPPDVVTILVAGVTVIVMVAVVKMFL